MGWFNVLANVWINKRKRWILIGTILLIVVLVGLLIGTLFLTNKDEEVVKFCPAEGFNGTDDILRSMNPLANPCHNFYEYACGNYGREHCPAPLSPSVYNEGKYYQRIEEILNMTSTADDHIVLKYAREVYHGCLTHTPATFINVPSYIRTMITKILNIPSSRTTKEMTSADKNNISEIIAELILSFIKPLFDVRISLPSTWTREKFILEIREPELKLPLELETTQLNPDSEDFQSFATSVVDLMQVFSEQNSSITKNKLRELATDIIQFEHGLFVLTNPPKNEDSYEKISALQLDELAGNANASMTISVRYTLNYLLEKGGRPPLKDDDKISIFNSTVFSTLLSFISSAKQETLVNYLGYRTAEVSYSDIWNTNSCSEDEECLTPVQEIVLLRPRRKECITTVEKVFLPVLYSHPHSEVNHDIIKDIHGIFLNVKNELILTQRRNNHLTPSQRERILDGIQRIQFCPDKLMLNSTELDEYYSGLNPFEESNVDRMWALDRWTNAKEFSLHGKLTPDSCGLFHDISGATTITQFLQISIPLNEWMEPFYNFGWPAYLKYSGIGAIIGHELIHVMYFLNPDMTNNSRQCIIDHYEGFSGAPERTTFGRWSYEHLEINGTMTLQNDFCDIAGLRLAYSAYKTEMKKMGETEFPLLTNYSNDQLFFYNHARGFCNWDSFIEQNEYMQNASHSLDILRVFGPLRNNGDFADVFKCPKGSFMNPVEKCEIF